MIVRNIDAQSDWLKSMGKHENCTDRGPSSDLDLFRNEMDVVS